MNSSLLYDFFFLLEDTSRNCLSLLQCCFEQQKAFLISAVNPAHTICKLNTLHGYLLQSMK